MLLALKEPKHVHQQGREFGFGRNSFESGDVPYNVKLDWTPWTAVCFIVCLVLEKD